MVDTDDTRRTTDDGRRTTDDGRRTTPRVWHKLPTGELKTEHILHISKFNNLQVLTARYWTDHFGAPNYRAILLHQTIGPW